MKARELGELLSLRWPTLNRTERVLARCVTVADLEREAGRRWPRGVRGYVAGGADDEVSLRQNLSAFERFRLVPRTLQDVSQVDTSQELLGCLSAYPFALGPTGYTRMMHPAGELAAAAAARTAGIPYTLSTMATTSIETVAERCGGDLWFQLYIWRDRKLVDELLDRAAVNGYRALMLTVDTAVTGLRARDIRNGFTLPPRLTPRTLFDMTLHPAWCIGLLRGEPISFANFAKQVSARSQSVMEFAAQQFDPTVGWEDLARIRQRWRGPLVIKGILSPDDTARAAEAGVDAVVLSNHGGRQLDGAVPPILMLPAVRERVGSTIRIFVDSGIRSGTHIVVALALGADGCLIGRPYLYGLGAAGERGVHASIAMLGEGVRRSMALLGVTSIDEIRARGSALLAEAP